MKKVSKILSVAATIALFASSAIGCGSSSGTSASKDYDFYIFNVKSENSAALTELCKEYEKETGIVIKDFSLGTADGIDALRAEMNSKNKPAIFSATAETLPEWEEGGFILDFNDVTNEEFKALAQSVPQSMRLSSDGIKSYGIPYNIEGYGLIVNTKMISDLFALKNTDSFISDFKTSTYDEFEALVLAVDAYINNNTVSTIKLSGKEYKLADSKIGLADNLTGVFAEAGAEKWTYGDHVGNFALNAVFDSLPSAQNATDEQIDALKNPLKKTVQLLELMTSHAAGTDGPLKRSPDFINSTTSGYDQSVQLFADNKALFIKQGNWVYSNIEKVNPDMVKSLTMLPVKLPLTEDDIKIPELTVEKFNSSVPEFVPSYYAINKKVSEEEQKLAQDFLVWLNTSETGKKFINEKFAFIPFNADENIVLENPLNNALIQYKQEGNILSNPFNGAPPTWGQEVFGKILMEQYLIKEGWTEEDYDTIANYSVEQWKAMK